MSGARWAERLEQGLQGLRDIHSDLTVLQLQMFLQIVSNPGMTQTDHYKSLNISDSGASRQLALLSNVGTRSRPGMDLIRLAPHPTDRRAKIIELTPKGERVATLLRQQIGQDDGSTKEEKQMAS